MTLRMLRKTVKRNVWRLFNLSFKQFFLEFVLRRFRTVELDKRPHYEFDPIALTDLAAIDLQSPLPFFLMVKPSGLAELDVIKRLITDAGMEITEQLELNCFFELAHHIFNIDKIHDYRHDLPEGHIWLKLLELFFEENHGNAVILFVRNGTEKMMNDLKRQIRRKVGVDFFKVHVDDIQMVTCMTPVHTPDESSLEFELKVIRYLAARSGS